MQADLGVPGGTIGGYEFAGQVTFTATATIATGGGSSVTFNGPTDHITSTTVGPSMRSEKAWLSHQ